MDKLKECQFCGKPIYIKVKQCAKSLLMPLTHVDELHDELIDITGENFVQIQAGFCPVCGKSLTCRAEPENNSDELYLQAYKDLLQQSIELNQKLLKQKAESNKPPA